ncbi:sulfatase-like hydrolase/transferase [Planctomycetaceae bacterium]|jgi:arylsulfatase A|nr:sulfatase-like hydrolase/transferase [Planctomycetaceae bacterium]MDC0261748.1 sulfatase-like hydrolase/transferase [Planctomycetaceae bacterium]MDC0273466.1 sulfatase-like hydrolase/transferase [Planctomycetaceae bacterium]MDC0307834.1 sulfatase-like hydrolase/transferase [Planctomycetaceae bacterium]MDG2389516.1 sulfatase-like hydrolase/transferase [Planctomycetaceae bacterium]
MKLYAAFFIISFYLYGNLHAADSPNIVLIISDDQAWTDFGFMGHPHVKTPHIDRLAKQSARYPNGYVPTSVCRPSLVTLLTGLYPHQHGVHFNHPPPGNSALSKMTKPEYHHTRDQASYLIRSAPSLPRILGDNGYQSFQTGKFWEGHFRNAGFTHGMTVDVASPEPAYGNRKLPDGSLVAHGNGDAGLNIGRDTMQPIADFLDAHGKQPFLLWYAPFLPHEPHNSPEKYRTPYENNPAVPKHLVDYYASCSQFDNTVSQLMQMIEARSLTQNTIFVFVIDNGWQPKETAHSQTGKYPVDIRSKRSPFDYGLRTPILIRWDGHVKPATHKALCNSVDIVPTILDAVGCKEFSGKMPGRSLLPSAMEKTPLADGPVFGEIYPGDATSLGHPSRDIAYRWVRDGRWKLIVPHRQRGDIWRNYVKTVSLFDVVADPHEQSDLSKNTQQQQRIQKMSKLLDDWWTPGDDSAVPQLPE